MGNIGNTATKNKFERGYKMRLNRTFTMPSYRRKTEYSIGYLDSVPFYESEYEFLLERNPECYQKIQEWVENNLMPFMSRQSINERHSSYGLKHIAENELGFYVSNGDIKLALMEEGVPFKEYPGSPNVCYPLSQKFYKAKERRNI